MWDVFRDCRLAVLVKLGCTAIVASARARGSRAASSRSRRALLRQREMSIVAVVCVLPVAIVLGARVSMQPVARRRETIGRSRRRRPDRTSTDVPSSSFRSSRSPFSLRPVDTTLRTTRRSSRGKFVRCCVPMRRDDRDEFSRWLSREQKERSRGKAHDVGSGWRPSRTHPALNCKETTGIGRLQYSCSCM